MFLAEQRTRHAANQEDLAMEEVPERAEMIAAMRKEFPHIDFSAK
jgi:hypothetical protein